MNEKVSAWQIRGQGLEAENKVGGQVLTCMGQPKGLLEGREEGRGLVARGKLFPEGLGMDPEAREVSRSRNGVHLSLGPPHICFQVPTFLSRTQQGWESEKNPGPKGD